MRRVAFGCCLLLAPARSFTSFAPQRAAFSKMSSFSSDTQSSSLKVALCQFLVGADKPANIARASSSIDEAVAGGAQLVVLPEIWNSPYSTSSFREYAEPVPEPGTGTYLITKGNNSRLRAVCCACVRVCVCVCVCVDALLQLDRVELADLACANALPPRSLALTINTLRLQFVAILSCELCHAFALVGVSRGVVRIA